MAKHLNLVESDFEQLEKRVLPRFPFCYLTFKCAKQLKKTFEVKDISYSGMQLSLKDGEHDLLEDEVISGMLHWAGRELEISGNVVWKTSMRAGIEFSNALSSRNSIDDFLKLEFIAEHLKPVHLVNYGVDLPAKLKYWLRADGPVELFVWQHADGEFAKFQVLIMENFVEWEDGKGLKTSRVISKRDIETPLINEDEFVFKIDESIDESKVTRAAKLISGINESNLAKEVKDFVQLKLRS